MRGLTEVERIELALMHGATMIVPSLEVKERIVSLCSRRKLATPPIIVADKPQRSGTGATMRILDEFEKAKDGDDWFPSWVMEKLQPQESLFASEYPASPVEFENS